LRNRPARLLANAVLVFSVAILIAVGLWYVFAEGVQPSSAGVHLTRADWQTTQANDMTLPPLTIDTRSLPDAWQPAVLPQAMPATRPKATPGSPVNTIGGVTWIRVFTRGLSLPAGPLVLYGSRIRTDGTIAIYADGQLIYRAQKQGPLWDSLFTPLWVELDRRNGDAPLDEILIRLEHTPTAQVGLASLWLGTADALRGRYYMRQWLQLELPVMLSTSFLMVGIFALCVWFWRREETGYLIFFNLAATSFVGHLHYYASVPITSDWFAWLTQNALFWLIMVIHFFLCQLHGRPLKWLTRTVVGITGAITLLTLPVVGVLPVLPNTPVIVPLIYAVAILMGATVGLVGVLIAWRRSWEARLLAAGVGVCTLLGVSDWLMHNNVISQEGWFLGAYMNAVTFAVCGYLMYRRYVNAILQVERVNANLAQSLRAREAELEESHRLLREAERHQTISDERRRLMQDMHDGLGSSLISAIRSVERGGASDSDVSGILKRCLDDLKLTIDSMEPVEADLLLLLGTLRFRLEPRLEGTGIALLWEVQKLPPLPWLDPSSALHILRIVQESIANILHHTRASEIRVSTLGRADGVQVIIEDNGQGFDVQRALAAVGKGHGLHNQQRRAQAVGGSTNWVSGPEGTRFTLWLPLERVARPA
jgi:signal transduction histidine kinase